MKPNTWMFFLFVFFDVTLYGLLGNVVGNSFFASLSQLKALWNNEVVIVHLLENMVEKCENPPAMVKM